MAPTSAPCSSGAADPAAAILLPLTSAQYNPAAGGMIAALISVLLTILYFWFTVVVLGLDFYIMPPV